MQRKYTVKCYVKCEAHSGVVNSEPVVKGKSVQWNGTVIGKLVNFQYSDVVKVTANITLVSLNTRFINEFSTYRTRECVYEWHGASVWR